MNYSSRCLGAFYALPSPTARMAIIIINDYFHEEEEEEPGIRRLDGPGHSITRDDTKHGFGTFMDKRKTWNRKREYFLRYLQRILLKADHIRSWYWWPIICLLCYHVWFHLCQYYAQQGRVYLNQLTFSDTQHFGYKFANTLVLQLNVCLNHFF